MSYSTVYKHKVSKKKAASGGYPDGWDWAIYTTKSNTDHHLFLREFHGGKTYRDLKWATTHLVCGMFPIPVPMVNAAEEVQ